jgi:hypothetical protein
MYLLAHVAFYWRSVGNLKPHRLAGGIVLAALAPVATQIDALAALVLVTAPICLLIVFENIRYADSRRQIRAELAHHSGSDHSEAPS